MQSAVMALRRGEANVQVVLVVLVSTRVVVWRLLSMPSRSRVAMRW